MKIILYSATVLVLTFACSSFAQDLPANDVWLAHINNGLPGSAAKISTGDGYNNQPHFSTDGSRIYYTREMTDSEPSNSDDTQTDIAVFDIKASATSILNDTATDEYSPTPIPGREAVSVIRVEPDQKQRLWAIDIKTGEMELLLPTIEPVGYHAWINGQQVAMFILGESFSLQIADLNGSEARLVADNIGRSIRLHPLTGEILFVDKNREPWQIAAYHPQSGQLRGVMPLFPDNEDFTVDANGSYWSGNGTKLYQRSEGDRAWNLKADFSADGITQISRLAISPNNTLVALVSDH